MKVSLILVFLILSFASFTGCGKNEFSVSSGVAGVNTDLSPEDRTRTNGSSNQELNELEDDLDHDHDDDLSGDNNNEESLVDTLPEEYLCDHEDGGRGVLVCHVPHGNSSQMHTKCLCDRAARAHLDHHQDKLGHCFPE